MRMREITEAPERIPSSAFNLDDDAINRAFAAKQMARVAEVIRTSPHYQLVRTGDGTHGWFLLYNEITELADYVVQYQSRRWKWFPRTVTQCILWRRAGSVFTRNITTEMFFDILLPRYGAIMSDRQQTDQGHNYWIDRMADAVDKGKQVGVADMNTHTVEWYAGVGHTGVSAWIKQQNAFGAGHRYQALRYVIVN